MQENVQDDFKDRSRRPHTSPTRSPDAIEQAVLELRREHPAWGGRKIAQRMLDLGQAQLAPSTITHILHRHGLITPQASCAAQPWLRFEHDTPNSLWQIDFKGHFATLAGRCHGLTLLDDHSRFNLLLGALSRTDANSVQAQLTDAFRRYGLPLRINADNGAPWGSPSSGGHSLSELAIWLIRLRAAGLRCVAQRLQLRAATRGPGNEHSGPALPSQCAAIFRADGRD